jgi:ABC-2 type transport system permease protein
MVLTLLSVRWLSLRNSLVRSDKRERRRTRASLLVSAGVILGVGGLAYTFFEPFVSFSASDRSMREALVGLPSFAFFSAFWMLMLSAVTVGIQTFYLSQEMPLLLATPTSPRAIFGAKFAEATAANAGLFVTIGAPLLLAYGFARGTVTPPFLFQVLLVLLAYAALPTGLGLLLSFILMRILPANRTRDILAALGVAAFAGVYFILSVGVTRMHDSDAGALRYGAARLAETVSAPLFGRGPWAWAGQALNGEYADSAVWHRIGLLAVCAGMSVAITSLAAQLLHWRGWVNAQEIASTQRSAQAVSGAWERRLSRMPGPVRGVFLKDIRTLRRDMRQLSMFFIPMAVVAVFLFNVAKTPGFHRIEPVLFTQTLFVMLAPISLRLAMGGFVGENRAFWLMLTAPNDPITTLGGKFMYAYMLTLPLAVGATALYAALVQLSGVQMLVSTTLVVCAMAGFCGIGVGACALLADFGADNPRFTISAGARLVMFGFQLLYLVLLALTTTLAWAFVKYRDMEALLIYSVAGLAVIAVSLAFGYTPLALGARRLRRLEW